MQIFVYHKIKWNLVIKHPVQLSYYYKKIGINKITYNNVFQQFLLSFLEFLYTY